MAEFARGYRVYNHDTNEYLFTLNEQLTQYRDSTDTIFNLSTNTLPSIYGLLPNVKYNFRISSYDTGTSVTQDTIVTSTTKEFFAPYLQVVNDGTHMNGAELNIDIYFDRDVYPDSFGYRVYNEANELIIQTNNLDGGYYNEPLKATDYSSTTHNHKLVVYDTDNVESTPYNYTIHTLAYEDKTDLYSLKQVTYSNIITKFAGKLTMFRNRLVEIVNKEVSYTNLLANFPELFLFYSSKVDIIKPDFWVSNNFIDSKTVLKQSCSTNYSWDYVGKALITTNGTYNFAQKSTSFSNYADSYSVVSTIFNNRTKLLNLKPAVYTPKTNNFSDIITICYIPKNMMLSFNMKVDNTFAKNMYIKPAYGNDFYYRPWSIVEIVTSNPIIPVDVQHRDIVWNEIFKDIRLISNINKVRILCVGDSITAGAPAYDPRYGGTIYMADLVTGKVVTKNNKESEYPYWLQVRLGIDDYEVINEGTGRQNSKQISDFIEGLLKYHRPQFCIILIGTNDIFYVQDRSKAEMATAVTNALDNIRKTADTIRLYRATPILGTNLPRNSIVPPNAKDALRQLNAGIKNLGIEKTLDVIDWYDMFVAKDTKVVNGEEVLVENGTLNPSLSGDDTHPNVTGYKMMAEGLNLGIFNSFRAVFRLFNSLDSTKKDVDYKTEEIKETPNPYTINYTLSLPHMKRIQTYNVTKYLKNTGNSWGMFVLEVDEDEDIAYIWDDKIKGWNKYLTGQLAPDDIMTLKVKFTTPAMGRYKNIKFKITFIEFRR